MTLVFATVPATNSTTVTANGSCDIADLRLYDDNGDLLDQFYLNEHTDMANGLDGLPVVGRNSNIGQYIGCGYCAGGWRYWWIDAAASAGDES